MKLHLFLLFFSFVHIPLLCAQDPYYINYNTKDGLPSSQTYHSYEDEKGYMWFTTDRGVVKYDGYVFKTYTTEEGLSSLVNFNFYKDKEGSFWVNGYDGSLSFWNGKKFTPFKFNWKLKKLLRKPGWFHILDIDEGSISLLNDSQYGSKKEYFTIDRNTGDIKKHLFNKQIKLDKRISDLTIFKLNDSIQGTYDDLIIQIKDQKNYLWKFTRTGAQLYKNGDLRQTPIHYFKNIPISSVYRNNHGNYWFTTLDRGLLYVPSLEVNKIKTSSNQDSGYSNLKIVDNTLVAKLNERPISLFFIDPSNYFFSSIGNSKGTFLERSKFLRYYAKDRLNQLDDFSYNRLKLSNGYYFKFTGNSFGILQYKNGEKKPISNYESKSFCAIEDKNKNLWIGTKNGLLTIDLTDSNYQVVSVPLTKKDSVKIRVTDIALAKSGLWIATLSNGLIHFSDTLQNLDHPKLKGKTLECLYEENDSILWVGTNKGLLKVCHTNTSKQLAITEIQSYTTQDGLHDNAINDILFWQEKLYVATNRGISFFDPSTLRKHQSIPKININTLYVNGKETDFPQERYEFSSSQKNIKITFTGVTLNKPILPEFFYRYRLNDQNWNYTNNRSAEYQFLPPGDYKFDIQCQNNDGNWSQLKTVQFSIAPHFSQLLLFRLGVLLLVIVSLTFLIRRRIRLSEEKVRKELKYKESELATLRNQMNPHFVFNSLNTLQDFIFDGNILEANQYIGDFASLMRKSLEFSKMEKIILTEEIQFIENYLHLEKKRYEDKFDFTIETNVDLKTTHLYITPLLIQPIAENAVKHAFKKFDDDQKGFIKIRYIQKSEQIMSVEIIDNGSGFERTQIEASNAEHKSMGIQIIKQRIELMNQKLNRKDFRMELKSSEKGTAITLILPIFN